VVECFLGKKVVVGSIPTMGSITKHKKLLLQVISWYVVMTKKKEKQLAVHMRNNGSTIPNIAQTLNISQGTASAWLRDIQVPPHILNKIKKEATSQRSISRSKTCLQKRLQYRNSGKEAAQLKDPLHHAACMLYWAEGAKKINCCVFCNTDPDMLMLFNDFLEKYFPQHPKKLYIQHHNDSNSKNVCDFWTSLLGIYNVGPSIIKDESKNRKNRHNNGVCSIYVNSTEVVQHIYGAINEYIGVEKEFALKYD
jgi:hypothetical protein